jgi:uncharacterized protein (DUF433 family)
MATTSQITYPHIVSDPGIQGGEPVVAGTRIPVRAVVVAWQEDRDVPTLLQAFPRLTEETLAEALAYYKAHREQIDQSIAAQLADT